MESRYERGREKERMHGCGELAGEQSRGREGGSDGGMARGGVFKIRSELI